MSGITLAIKLTEPYSTL